MTTAKEIRDEQAARRRARLAEVIRLHFDGKQADFIARTNNNQGELSGLLKDKSFGGVKARGLEEAAGLLKGCLDMPEGSPFYPAGSKHISTSADEGSTSQNPRIVTGTTLPVGPSMLKEPGERFDKNVTPSPLGQRRIPVISYVQAGMMTEVVDPFELGGGFETILTDLDVSGRTFALIIDGPSMLPEFNEGDKVIIDPALSPRPGDFVVAKNGKEEATFKKYRPRSTGENGEMVFELVPLNDDFPVLQSERDHLRIVGVMVEHRKYRRR